MKKLLTLIIIFSRFTFVHGASISFFPNEATFTKNCPFKLDIMLDTEDLPTNTVDLSIFANEKFEIIDIDIDNWIFSSYTPLISNKARYQTYKDKKTIYFMGTTLSKTGFIWSGKVATITVLPKNKIKNLDLERYMIPHYNWDDSNVSVISENKVYDALSTAKNGKYTFKKWICKIENLWSSVIQTTNKDYNPWIPNKTKNITTKHNQIYK